MHMTNNRPFFLKNSLFFFVILMSNIFHASLGYLTISKFWRNFVLKRLQIVQIWLYQTDCLDLGDCRYKLGIQNTIKIVILLMHNYKKCLSSKRWLKCFSKHSWLRDNFNRIFKKLYSSSTYMHILVSCVNIWRSFIIIILHKNLGKKF